MMKKKIRIAGVACASLGLLFFTGHAQAENCKNFLSDPMWQVNFEHLQNELFEKNYEAALESAKVLFSICPRSPAANYYTGLALLNSGEKSRALTMFQKASEYTSEFAVTPELSRQIWYARYEAENPESSPESIQAMKQKTAELEAELEKYKTSSLQYEAQLSSSETLQYVVMDNERESFRRKFKALMWSGTAVGGLGIASIAAGAALAAKHKDKPYEDITANDASPVRDYEIRPGYKAGISLLGIGAALTAAGAVMAGFGAYHYLHTDQPLSFQFHIAPDNAGIQMTF